MNFLDIKAGETIEVGTQKAYRFWRYVFPPHHAPVRLLSWVSDTRWRPRQFVQSAGNVSSLSASGMGGI